MKKLIAIIAGGDSSEREVSLKSAQGIRAMIDTNHFDVSTIVITNNQWDVTEGPFAGQQVNLGDFSVGQGEEARRFDFAFIAIHGHPGENGVLQGFFETLGIPYSTGDVRSTSLSFDKRACNLFLAEHEVRSARTIALKKGEHYNKVKIIEALGLPLFVKPNQAGSSFGASKVNAIKELDAAIEKAWAEHEQILIDEYIEGTELTCGALKTKDKEYILPLTEIVSKNDFFDFQAKYTAEFADEITPARVPESVAADVQYLTSHIYDLLGCKGLVRADYIWSKKGIYFLELNAVPGMTERSLVPQQIEALGLNKKELATQWILDRLSDEPERNTLEEGA